MPYEISFSKSVEITNREQYINECCVGGDLVVDQLLPSIRARYADVQTNQEDWGWFIWFRKGKVKLAFDVTTDDPAEGAFRVHLSSRVRRWLVLDAVADTAELEELRALVESALSAWVGRTVRATPVDEDFNPKDEA